LIFIFSLLENFHIFIVIFYWIGLLKSIDIKYRKKPVKLGRIAGNIGKYMWNNHE